MESERYFSGYCRVLDSARVVEVILEDGIVTETDCRYGQCDFQPNCPIARAIEEAKQN
ncbi:MAG: hypothetical protein IJ960_08605 [Oscillospiraceae bacterium]|nr:hypothetical protein [Oscillospiraceae bacterium]